MPRELGVNILKKRVARGRAKSLGLFHRGGYLFQRFFLETSVVFGAQEPPPSQILAHPVDGIAAGPRLDIVPRLVTRGVVTRRMWGYPVS